MNLHIFIIIFYSFILWVLKRPLDDLDIRSDENKSVLMMTRWLRALFLVGIVAHTLFVIALLNPHTLIFLINGLLLTFLFIFAFIPAYKQRFMKDVSLAFSIILFLISLLLLRPILKTKVFLLKSVSIINITNLSVHSFIGIDGLSVFYIILTTFLIISCTLLARNIHYRIKELFLLLFLLEFLLINSFVNIDIFLFYLFFEVVLIPMYFIIGIWGSQKRKIVAASQFFLYTLFGSFFLLSGIILLYTITGTTNILYLKSYLLYPHIEKLLFILFFISFAAKIPMFPLHLWLPKAHVEAPTIGSVLLAGILLKLGSYAFLRFSLYIFPNASFYFAPLVMVIAVLSIVYAAFVTMRQTDLKRIIAYSSISHMNFLIGGLFSNTIQGLTGSLLLQIAHGLSSSALFICVGFLYDRYKSRNIYYYSSLVTIMPFFAFMFFFFNLANLGFPGTINFVSEFLIMVGVYSYSQNLAVLFLISVFISALYSFILISRLLFGNGAVYIRFYFDLSRREFYTLLPYVLLVCILGFKPNALISYWTYPLETWYIH